MHEECSPTYQLSKSRYLSGLTCLKKLWKESKVPVVSADDDPVADFRKHEGTEVGMLARQAYEDGVLIDRLLPLDVISNTGHVIEIGSVPICEAGFAYDGVYVRADILEPSSRSRWNMIEVKSGVDVKPEYLDDLAIQYYVLPGSGLLLNQVRVRYLNRECRYPDLSNLFIEHDVTAEVLQRQSEIPARLGEMKRVLDGPEPEALIGEHCDKPFECAHRADCWQHVPEQSIFQIPNLQWKKKNGLINSGILAISEIPGSFNISTAQREYVNRTLAGTPVIDQKAIEQKMSGLKYPLKFLDFETDNIAIPRFDGCGPYTQVPYQHSCHVLQDGSLSHTGYLHTEMSDPRRPLAEHLIKALGSDGTIVSYNASFEKRVIRSLAAALPDLAPHLEPLVGRFWDQLDIFRQDYFHPKFGGSASIKLVLPALLPQLSYATLEVVHNGTEAGAVWNRAIRETDQETKEKDLASLWEYCKLDTLAMVELHQHLLEVCST